MQMMNSTLSIFENVQRWQWLLRHRSPQPPHTDHCSQKISMAIARLLWIPSISLLHHGFGYLLDVCTGEKNVPDTEKVGQKKKGRCIRGHCGTYLS